MTSLLDNFPKEPPIFFKMKTEPAKVVAMKKEQHSDNSGLYEPEAALTKRLVFITAGNKVADLSRHPQDCVMRLEEAKNTFRNLPMVKRGDNNVTAITDWLASEDRLTARGIGYKPGAGRLYGSQGELWVNTFYMPEWPVPADFVKASLLIDHLELLVPNEKDRLLFIQWLAATVHRPELRSGFTPLMISHQHGLGRGWLVSLIQKMVGQWNCSTTKIKIMAGKTSDGQYQNYLYRTLFCSIPEVRVGEGKYDIDDEVRDKLTDTPLNLNIKYGDNGVYDIYTNFLMASNSRDALVISKEDRRIFVTESNEPKPTPEYFREIYGMLNDPEFVAQCFYWLKGRLTPDYYVQQVAPMTDAKRVMVNLASSDLEQIYNQMIDDDDSVADVVSFATFKGYAISQGYEWVDEADRVRANSIFRARALPLFGGTKKRMHGSAPMLFYAIRNPGKWQQGETQEIRDEYGKFK